MEGLYRSLLVNSVGNGVRVISIIPSLTDLRCELKVFPLSDRRQHAVTLRPTSSPAGVSLSDGDLETDPPLLFPEAHQFRFCWGDFAALSYEWGDTAATTNIFINGIEFQATKNLAAVLHTLRDMGAFITDSGYYLWVDAVCINQTDAAERTREVARMRYLYSTAASVVTWLGPAKDKSDKAFRLLRVLSRYYGSEVEGTRLREMLSSELDPEHDVLKAGEGNWLAVNRLTLRSYWERLWIIQELALGGERTIILCGQDRIPWQQMCYGFGVIHQFLWVVKDQLTKADRQKVDVMDTRTWENSGPMHHIWKDLWAASERSDAPDLTRLLEIATYTKCYDPRDRIYGLLGLMDAALADRISSDYTVDAPEVFKRFCLAYMDTYKSLEFLRDANCWGSSGAPTWVPDWTWTGRLRDSRPDKKYSAIENSGLDLTDMPTQTSTYFADRGIMFEGAQVKGQYLYCWAIIFDSVDGLGAKPCSVPRALQSRLCQNAAYVDETVVPCRSMERTHRGWDDIAFDLSTALYADRSVSSRSSHALLHLPTDWEEAEKLFKERRWDRFSRDGFYYSKWTQFVNSIASLRINGNALEDYFTSNPPESAQSDDYWEAYQDFQRTLLGRRFALTKRGQFAWVPNHRDGPVENQACSGDVFAIIPGCSAPILLRPANQSFQVVGEAYVQGFMEGEMTQKIKKKQYIVQKIALV